MKSEKTQEEDFGGPRFDRVNSVLVPVVATCLVCLEIVLHWVIFKKLGKGEKQRLTFMARIAYVSLLLATVLFNR